MKTFGFEKTRLHLTDKAAGTPEPITGAEVKELAREWGSSMWEILQQIEAI